MEFLFYLVGGVIFGYAFRRHQDHRRVQKMRLRIAAQTRQALDAGYPLSVLLTRAAKRLGYDPLKTPKPVMQAVHDMIMGTPTEYSNEESYLRLLDGWDLTTELLLEEDP